MNIRAPTNHTIIINSTALIATRRYLGRITQKRHADLTMIIPTPTYHTRIIKRTGMMTTKEKNTSILKILLDIDTELETN